MGSSLLYFLSDDQWESITAWLYGTGLSGLFIMSTMFHTVSWKKSHLQIVEQRFHMCDRMVIYFFIAASYTPWLNLRELGPWAAHMRWLVWIMACVGSAYVFFFHEKNKILDLICYIVMGAVPALVLLSMPNREGVLELSMGGVFYCMGVVFFKSDGLVPFAHAIWHVFVAVGAAIHYYAIWKYLYATGSSHIRSARKIQKDSSLLPHHMRVEVLLGVDVGGGAGKLQQLLVLVDDERRVQLAQGLQDLQQLVHHLPISHLHTQQT